MSVESESEKEKEMKVQEYLKLANEAGNKIKKINQLLNSILNGAATAQSLQIKISI